MISNEYTYRTIKQNLIDGLSKKEFLLSKLLTIVFLAIISTVFIFLIAFSLGLINTKTLSFSTILSETSFIVAFFISQLSFFIFCLFSGVLIKRSAFALGFLMLAYLGESIINLILRFTLFKSNPETAKFISSFFPFESINNLIISPLTRLEPYKQLERMTQIQSSEFTEYLNFSNVVIVLFWCTLFVYLSYQIIKKRDL